MLVSSTALATLLALQRCRSSSWRLKTLRAIAVSISLGHSVPLVLLVRMNIEGADPKSDPMAVARAI